MTGIDSKRVEGLRILARMIARKLVAEHAARRREKSSSPESFDGANTEQLAPPSHSTG